MGNDLLTYTMSDPIQVTKFSDAALSTMTKTKLTSLDRGLTCYSVTPVRGRKVVLTAGLNTRPSTWEWSAECHV